MKTAKIKTDKTKHARCHSNFTSADDIDSRNIHRLWKNAGGGVDGTESSGTNADGSAGGGKGRFIESKVALPEEINSILRFKALSDGTLEIVGQDADYSIYVVKAVMEAETGRQHR